MREGRDREWWWWKIMMNTSLAAPGALANGLQRRTARKANEANLAHPLDRPKLDFTN